MGRSSSTRALAFLIALISVSPCVAAPQDTALAGEKQWDEYTKSGLSAVRRGQYATAEAAFNSAIDLACTFDANDPRIARSFFNLANLERDTGRYHGAEQGYLLTLKTQELVGPNYPDLADTLESYAQLLRKMKRRDEAKKLQARAQAIREAHK